MAIGSSQAASIKIVPTLNTYHVAASTRIGYLLNRLLAVTPYHPVKSLH